MAFLQGGSPYEVLQCRKRFGVSFGVCRELQWPSNPFLSAAAYAQGASQGVFADCWANFFYVFIYFFPLWPAFELRPEKIGKSQDGTPERGAALSNPLPYLFRTAAAVRPPVTNPFFLAFFFGGGCFLCG